MSSSPPASAFAAARIRQQEAVVALAPGTVTIGGTPYSAAVKTATRTLDMADGGSKVVMGFEASILKTDLVSEPVLGTIVKIDSLGFKITELDGRNSFDKAWVIRGMRLPGQDG